MKNFIWNAPEYVDVYRYVHVLYMVRKVSDNSAATSEKYSYFAKKSCCHRKTKS